MCGRFHRELSWRQVHEFLDLQFPTIHEGNEGAGSSVNVAPTHLVPVCTLGIGGARALELMHWGITPRWSRDAKMLINARSETAATGPGFRDAWRHRRCVIPATGFYEWKQEGNRKIPMLFAMHDASSFAMAGLWEPATATAAASMVVLTMSPNELVAPVHDRMPVMLRRREIDSWLADGDGEFLREPFRAEEMVTAPAAADLSVGAGKRKVSRVDDVQPGLFG